MAVLSDISFDWAQSPRLITVAAPRTSVSVQDLYDTCRDAEDEPINLGFDHIISAGGKEPLDVALGSAVGITATLLNAVIKFEDRGTATVCKVSGGNLVAQDADGLPIDPLIFSTNVLAFIAQSSSATINDVSLTQRLQHLIASQDATHSPYGNFFYVDHINGDDTNDALLPETARATVQSVHDDLCSGYTRDTIIVLARDPSGVTVINERIAITKNHILLHGPGRGCCFRPSDAAGPTISVVGAYGVELDSFRVQTHTTGTNDAISVSGGSNHCKVSNIYADVQAGEAITGNALSFSGGDHHIIQHMYIENPTDDGIHLEDVVSARVETCKIFGCGGDGIHVTATAPANTKHTSLNDNVIQQSTGYDLNIDSANVEDTAIRFLNDITDSSNLQDLGTNTQWERLNQAQFSAFQTWEEVGGDHLTPGTVGFNAAAMAYMGAVHIDTVNGTPGTVIGTNGTAGNPVNNLADAVIIDATLATRTFRVRGNITLVGSHDDSTFIGSGTETVIALNGQDTNDSFFEGCELSGNAANSHIHAHDCTLDGVTNFSGIFNNCRLRNNLSLSANSTMFAHCVSYVPGAGGTPIIDVQGVGRTFQFRAYSGGLEIRNMNDPGNAGSIELVAGQIILASTCTDGDLALRGIGSLTDNSAGTVVNTDALLNNSSSQTPEIKQAWTRAVSGGSKMLAVIALELGGKVITLPGTATLDVTVRDSTGSAVITQVGITPNAAGYFVMTEDPFTPSAGINLASFATITNGADVYVGLTPISFPEFS